MDPRWLADIRAAHGDGAGCQRCTRDGIRYHSGGAGYLVSPSLVLTAGHVVTDDDGTDLPVVDVWIGHQAVTATARTAATVAWQHPDPRKDLVLLRLPSPQAGAIPVRWGVLSGKDGRRYEGLGFPAFARYGGSSRAPEQLSGVIRPLSMGPAGEYVLDQDVSPDTEGQWAGVSGAAVFCDDLLVAVADSEPANLGHARLLGARASWLFDDDAFIRLVGDDAGTSPVLETVGLHALFSQSAKPVAATPGGLLAPAAETVRFHGRADVLDQLAAWRNDSVPLSVMLITAEGGQGKTRLAMEVIRASRASGWAAGFAAGRSLETFAPEIGASTRPYLLVVDYAETRRDLDAFLASLTQIKIASRFRLLLLARSEGSWWAEIRERHPDYAPPSVRLTALGGHSAEERLREYTLAADELWPRLHTLQYLNAPVLPWQTIGQQAAQKRPDFSGLSDGNVLTIHITALVTLLRLAEGDDTAPDITADAETELVRHERRYWWTAASSHGLFDRGTLSALANAPDRAQRVRRVLERAIAAAILLTPRDEEQVRAVCAFADTSHVDDIVSWLHALYSAPVESDAVGETASIIAIQPDRLAEFLLGGILLTQRQLLSELAPLISDVGFPYYALFTLARTCAHPGFSDDIGAQTAELVGRSEKLAQMAPLVIVRGEYDQPLREGLRRLCERDFDAFKGVADFARFMPELAYDGPQSAARMTLQADISEVLADVCREIPDGDADSRLPYLATLLRDLSAWRDAAGQPESSLPASRQAVAIYRELTANEPDAYLPELASALHTCGTVLGDLGQWHAALASHREAAAIWRFLTSSDVDRHLTDLGNSVNALAICYNALGQREACLTAIVEAVAIWRNLARDGSDTHLADLAMSLTNFGGYLSEAGRLADALVPGEEAIAVYQSLSQGNPGRNSGPLALALLNVAGNLQRLGQYEAAAERSAEAVALLRALAEENPGPYLPNLASALVNHSASLSKVGRHEDAVYSGLEAVLLLRQLAGKNTVHLFHLGVALEGLASQLFILERTEWALSLSEVATDIFRLLVQVSPGAYLPSLAGSLNNRANGLDHIGQGEDAAADVQESVAIYRALIRADPSTVAHKVGLITGLNTMSIQSSEAGSHETAISLIQEAIEILRKLAEHEPEAHASLLAKLEANRSRIASRLSQLCRSLRPDGSHPNHRRSPLDALGWRFRISARLRMVISHSVGVYSGSSCRSPSYGRPADPGVPCAPERQIGGYARVGHPGDRGGRADQAATCAARKCGKSRLAAGAWRGRGSGPGRRGEDGVGPYAPPDDVRLAGDAFSPVAEGRPPVAVPCHLEHARVGGHAFHAQARPEGAVRDSEVRDEGFLDHLGEGGPLLRREVLPVLLEAGKRLEGRHHSSVAPMPSR
jgi:tetratricopeptide (TPR) repeat protein